MTNKAKAVALIRSLQTGEKEPIGFINPEKYIQHNLMIEDGLEGFAKLLGQVPQGSLKAKVVRAFEDEDYVFLHTDYDFFGPKIGFDIFRFEKDLIVEHWDNLQEKVTQTKSGRGMIDGETKLTDLKQTKTNKKLIKNFVKDVLQGQNPGKITDYISIEQYYQHDPQVGDGLEGLGEAMKALDQAGTPMIYKKNHLVLGQGNFVLAVSEGEFKQKPTSFYDLFRIEKTKIVEHWDTIETIPPQEKWQNKNGKFNF